MKPVSRQQIEAQIQLMKGKVGLQERLCHTLKERGTREREFIKWIATTLTGNSVTAATVDQYLHALKQHYQAQSDAAEVTLAELKSQVVIAEAMLAEAENPSVISPGGVVLPS
jgi:hypothetical protein